MNVAEKEFIGIDDSEFDEIIYSPVCSLCKHFNWKTKIKCEDMKLLREHKCDAFPDDIPEEIWRGDNDHKKPYSGDHGIQFERV
jgi:hypothetical protein